MSLGCDGRWLRWGLAAAAGLLLLGAAPSAVRAAPGALAERTQELLAQLDTDADARAAGEPASRRARAALERAAAAPPAQAALLEELAFQNAELARDLARASQAERRADELEREARGLATEIARLRAVVEQALARLGRARQELKVLEASRAAGRPERR